MLHKKKPLTIKIKQKRITHLSLLLKKAIIDIFLSNYLHNYVNRVEHMKNGRQRNHFILTFLLQGCLVYQIY